MESHAGSSGVIAVGVLPSATIGNDRSDAALAADAVGCPDVAGGESRIRGLDSDVRPGTQRHRQGPNMVTRQVILCAVLLMCQVTSGGDDVVVERAFGPELPDKCKHPASINRAVFDERAILDHKTPPLDRLVPGPASPRVARHVAVYAVDGRFGGWPANHGIWSWGNEIVVGFSAGQYKDLGPTRHAIDRDLPEEHLLARSRDGGETWSIENPGKRGMLVGTKGMRHGTVPPDVREPDPIDCPGAIDFTHPDFALTARMANKDTGESRFYVSTDRARSWSGPFRLPLFGQPGIAARTDYIVNGKDDCLLFLTASKPDRREGRPICVRTTDGGKTWKLVALIGSEPTGYAIMPSTVRLSATDLLTTIRRRDGDDAWIDAHVSRDDGATWKFLTRPAADLGEGNPPALVRLRDGRLCLTYGVRKAPFAIHARLSRDDGATWGEPIVLRDDGAGRDLGYPRTVQRPDGLIVTVYYFHDTTDVDRTIQATLWDPGLR